MSLIVALFRLHQGRTEARRDSDRHFDPIQSIGSSAGAEHALDLEVVQKFNDIRRREATVSGVRVLSFH